MKYNYKDFTLEDIEKAMKKFYSKEPSDVVIDHDGGYFHVIISGGNIKVGTGYGGLKMYLDNPLPMLKIQYNGRILSKNEVDRLKLQLKNGKSAVSFKL